MNRNKIRSLPTECLLNNIIDEDFQEVLRPLGLFQNMFMMARFNVTSNFITPKNNTYYIKSAIAAVILLIMNYYRFLVYSTGFYISGSITFIAILWFDCIYCSVNAVMIYVINATQSSNTVLLIIKLQQSLHTLNFKSKMMCRMKIWNWIYIFSISSAFFIVFIITCGITNEIRVISCLVILQFFLFNLNVIYAARTVTFIGNVLELWNRKMLSYEKNNQEIEENKFRGKAMLNAYFNIVNSFNLAKEVYQFAITHHTIEIFLHALYTVQSYLEYLKLGTLPDNLVSCLLINVLAVLWSVKNVVLLISVSFACDKFYRNIEVTKAFCSKILKLEKSDLRRTCKNVVRFNRAAFRKLSAFGVFAVDAALPLRLLAAVLTYTVVLLQFAFL